MAKALNGQDYLVGEHFYYFKGDEIKTKLKSTNGVFLIGLEDTEECKSNNIDRYPYTPVAGYDCFAVTYGAWHQCDNKGQGGAVEAGCVRFSFRPVKPSDEDLLLWSKDLPL